MTATNTHIPSRPLWLCRKCREEWPCLPARTLLLVEYVGNRTALSVYLGTTLYTALEDFHKLRPNPGPDAAALFARFLAWAAPPRGAYWREE